MVPLRQSIHGVWAAILILTIAFPLSPVFGETMKERLTKAMNAGDLDGLHSTVLVLEGERIAEAYFQGHDERWGASLGIVDHGPETLHDMRSVTKSIVGLLYGIALNERAVPEIDAPLLDLFPQYPDLKDGSNREKITIRHALTMQMGTEWNENLPYTDPRNSEIAMEFAKDRYRFVLDRPMVAEPGTLWTYNGGAVAVIAKLIADGTGMSIENYAQEKLFKPLGITSFEWVRGADGVPSAASGLRLTARDLATLGVMVSQNGLYKGQHVVPSDWLEHSFRPAATIQSGFHYGFLWYVMAGPGGDPIMIAIGNGGQRLTIQPKFNFVLATFAGNYNDPNGWQLPLKVLLEFAIPEVRRLREE